VNEKGFFQVQEQPHVIDQQDFFLFHVYHKYFLP